MAAAASLMLLTGCVSWSGPGPMNLDLAGYGACAPTSRYQEVAAGIELGDPPDSDITIISVDTSGVDGADLVAAWLMPVGAEGHMGFLAFPPTEEFPRSWARSVLAEGATIPAGEAWDLVLQVRDDSTPGGTLSGITVRYIQNGIAHDTTPQMEIEFRPGTCD